MAGKNKFTALRKIRDWSCDDVQWVLTKNDLSDCCEAIKNQSIDGEALLNLTGKLAMWKRDLPNTQMQKLSTFVGNINFFPEKYCDGADDRAKPKTPAKKWGQPTTTGQDSSPGGSSPGWGKPALASKPPPPKPLGHPRPANGFRTTSLLNHSNKPVSSPYAQKPVPPPFSQKPNLSSNSNKPVSSPYAQKPVPPPFSQKPNLTSNSNGRNLSPDFKKPALPKHFQNPIPPRDTRPALPVNFSRPNAPVPSSKATTTNSSRPLTPNSLPRPSLSDGLQAPAETGKYLSMSGRKSPVPISKLKPVVIPAQKFPPANVPPTKPAPVSIAGYNRAALKKIPFPPDVAQEKPREKSPVVPDDEEVQPEYLNYEPDVPHVSPRGESPVDNEYDDPPATAGSDGWDTDFDDDDVGEEDDGDDHPPPVQNVIRNLSTLFGGNAKPSVPPRLPVAEPTPPARAPFQSASPSVYPQPPPALDNLISGLSFKNHADGMADYADDDEYSTIDELDGPSLPPRVFLDKPGAPITVPESIAPDIPHREPFVIPARRFPGTFASADFPEVHATTPTLPPREPYMKKFPGLPEPPPREDAFAPRALASREFGQRVEDGGGGGGGGDDDDDDDDEYEAIDNWDGQRDGKVEDDGAYLQPVSMERAVSEEAVSPPLLGGANLPEMLKNALTARILSLNLQPASTTQQETRDIRPQPPRKFSQNLPAPPTLQELNDKTPSLESKPAPPKPPPVERHFSSSQRPLPPTPDPTTRSSPGTVQSLHTRPWYHDVDRRHGEEMVRNGEDGCFLLRPSARTENPLTLTLWFEGRFFNIGVRLRPDQRYSLGSEKAKEKSFASVDEMVAFYQQDLLMLYSAGEKTGSTYLTSTPPR